MPLTDQLLFLLPSFHAVAPLDNAIHSHIVCFVLSCFLLEAKGTWAYTFSCRLHLLHSHPIKTISTNEDWNLK